ncbi:MAG: HDOD domain-containing protein [Bryobacterales bacterium]|nr:HDOD domain-containing protein [Bryobacterales bacterium]
MNSNTVPAEYQTRYDSSALSAHSRRVGMTAVEVAKRLGWAQDRQRMLREAADAHHDLSSPLDGAFLSRLITEIWGYSSEATPTRGPSGQEMAKLLELCCFFVQRWEFIPYELATYTEVLQELRAMVKDGFFLANHVECLANVPSVKLADIHAVVSKLPVFPAVALKAMKLAQNEMATAVHVEEVIGSDAVLAGEILRTANSPLYSPSIPVKSIRQAVVFLGLPECCRVITAAAFRPMFQSPLVRPLWNHSLEVARMAEVLSRTSGKADPEEAFLAGLMHDVGRLAIWKLPVKNTTQYATLLEQGGEAMFAETLLCGFDHTLAGKEVLQHWRMSQSLISAITYHHQPERNDSNLTHLLYLAEHCSGSNEDLPSLARLNRALEKTGIDQQQLGMLATPQSAQDW